VERGDSKMPQLELCEIRKYGSMPTETDTIVRMRTTCPMCHEAVHFVFPVNDPRVLGNVIVTVSKHDTSTKRFRNDYGDIPSLAEDIKQNGLIQPIVVDKRGNEKDYTYHLIAGERRLRRMDRDRGYYQG
jgi:hypothetical protein